MKSPFRYEIADRTETLIEAWSQLEAGRGHTPYQRRNWIEAWLRHAAPAEGLKPLLVLVRDEHARPLALFPLCEGRVGPARVARFAGGKHANFNMGLFAEDAAALLDRQALDGLTEALARLAGIDLLLFENQPACWQGFANPLSILPRQPSLEPAYKFELDSDFEALISRKLSKDARHKLRRKERKLAELGPVSFMRATTADEVEATLQAFQAQKAARFAQLGQPDVFAEPGVAAFIREAAVNGLAQDAAAIELHRCMVGERIVATYGAAIERGRFCGMFTSFDASEDVFRWSPGDLILIHLIESMCRRGLSVFDLGVGEARYKESYCDQAEDLFDSIVPLSMTGRVTALAVQAAREAKRRIKQSPQAHAFVNRLRRARA